MPIGPELVGRALRSHTTQWSERDTRLYSIAVGAGSTDPAKELQFTTANSTGVAPQVLPTFGVLEGGEVGVGRMLDEIPDVDLSTMLHGTQEVEQHRELPAAASVVTTGTITAVWDKGSAAVIETETVTAAADSGDPYVTCRQSLFFRGLGGWGGERGPRRTGGTPDTAPDHVIRATTRIDQALLYRLTGDTNPLHSDPAYARNAGFPRPILHGLCGYGIVGRLLLDDLLDGNPAMFRRMSGLFSAPVFPGDELVISVWGEGQEHSFVVDNQDGEHVITNGQFIAV